MVILWERKQKSKNRLMLHEVEEMIALLNEKIMTGSGVDEDRKRLSEAIDSRNHLVHIKVETLLQKSRARWMAEGDKNTRYFHKMANQRRIQNSIWELQDDTGGKIYKQTDLCNAAKGKFAKFYEEAGERNILEQLEVTRHFPRFFELDEGMEIFKNIDASEIRDVLNHFEKDKSPGPDGWTVEFILCFF